jgi:hypothetical protein
VFSFDRGDNERLEFELLQSGAEAISFSIPSLPSGDGGGVNFQAVSNASGTIDSLNNRLALRIFLPGTIQNEDEWTALLAFQEWGLIETDEARQELLELLSRVRSTIFPRSGIVKANLPENGVIQFEMADPPVCRQFSSGAIVQPQMGLTPDLYLLDEERCALALALEEGEDVDEQFLLSNEFSVQYPIELTRAEEGFVYFNVTLAAGTPSATQGEICSGAWNFILDTSRADNANEAYLTCIRTWETAIAPPTGDPEAAAEAPADSSAADDELLECLQRVNSSN